MNTTKEPKIASLEEALPIDTLNKLMEDIYDAVGVRVSFSTCSGERLAQTRYQNPFCVHSMEDPFLYERCQACTREASRRAAERGGIYSYICWRGLMSTSIQVLSEGKPAGNLVVSGYISTPDQMAAADQLFPDPALQVRPEDLRQIPFLHYEKVRDIIRTAGIAAGYLSELFGRLEAEEALRRAEKSQSQAEFRALQSQISPHFLFNTLNSISQMAVLEGAEQTPEAIYLLAALLRRTMKQTASLVPLEEELAFVREYVRIKQLLGRVPVTYHEELEPGTQSLRLPAFTIQPLVENAIFHGLEGRPEGGAVYITAGRDGGRILLTVTDDGVGFDPELVKPTASGEMTGVGFSNVLNRMRLFYGEGFENDVYSAPGEGTTVSFWIPVTP